MSSSIVHGITLGDKVLKAEEVDQVLFFQPDMPGFFPVWQISITCRYRTMVESWTDFRKEDQVILEKAYRKRPDLLAYLEHPGYERLTINFYEMTADSMRADGGSIRMIRRVLVPCPALEPEQDRPRHP